jgi:hypothetical protein
MKRYMLFGGELYYATGGVYDLLLIADFLDDIKSLISKTERKEYTIDVSQSSIFNMHTNKYTDDSKKLRVDWYHILDTHTMKIVESSNNKPYGYWKPQNELG